MKYFLAYLFLFLFSIELKASPITQDDTEKADSILSLISTEISNVNPVRALELATEALSLSRNADYSKGKAMSCFYIGMVMVYLGSYDKSLEYLVLSEQEKYTEEDFVIRTEIGQTKGQVYFYLGLNNASFEEFQKAYGYAVQIEDKEERESYVSMAYENFAIAYKVMKENPDSSFYWLKKNERLLAKTDESRTFSRKITLYTLLGNHYRDKKQYDTAISHYNKALSLITEYHDPYSSWLNVNWGDLYMQRGDADSALIYYRKGLENLKITNLQNELVELYYKIADIYSNAGAEDSAKFYWEKYLQVDNEIKESKNKATEKAFQILLENEQGYTWKKYKQAFLILGCILILLGLIAILSYELLKKRKNKMLNLKENEISELKQKLSNAFEELIELAKKNDSTLLSRMREVYPEFILNLLNRHPDLTNAELRLCVMIFLNFSSKEISEYMFITHRSVQTNKSRLRKKLGIHGGTDLYQYIKSFSN